MTGVRFRSTRSAAAWATAFFLFAGVIVVGPVPAEGASSFSGQWAVAASFPPLAADLAAVTCISNSACVAVGNSDPFGAVPAGPSSMMTTTDGGTSWHRDPVPSGDGLDGVACLTVDDCLVVAATATQRGVILSTSTGGTTWTVVGTTATTLHALSCAGATCVAVGNGMIERSADRGLHWSSAPVPVGVRNLEGISCATARHCVAVGFDVATSTDYALVSSDRGRRWQLGHVPATRNLPALTAVSCWSSRGCLAVGATERRTLVLRTTSGGMAWLRVRSPKGAPGELSSVSCVSFGRCVLGGFGVTLGSSIGYFNSRTNRVWSQDFPDGSGLFQSTAVSCHSARRCVAVGNQVIEASAITTSRIFGPWSTSLVARGVTTLSSISCPSQLVCTAVGGSPFDGVIATTSDGGTSWSEKDEDFDVYSVSCPSVTRCMVIGADYSGTLVLTTTDGGHRWSQAQPTYLELDGGIVSCETTARCTLASAFYGPGSFDAYYTDDFGATWSTAQVPGIFTGLAMTCTATGLCVAAGDHFVVSTDGGVTWNETDGDQQVPYVNGISCPSDTQCLAVGGVANGLGFALGSSDGGQTWQALGVPSSTQALDSVACPSVSMCVVGGSPDADGSPIVVTEDGGQTWTEEATPDQTTVNAVACPTTSECIATAGDDVLIGS